MGDLSSTIKAKSDQLNADDLVGGDVIIKVTDVKIVNNADQPVIIHYEGDNGKPFKPCKTVRRLLVAAWGTDSTKFIGKRMALYNDPDVTWAGEKVGGIRLKGVSDIKNPIKLTLALNSKKKVPHTIEPLKEEAVVEGDEEYYKELLVSGAKASEHGIDKYNEWLKTIDKTKMSKEHIQSITTKHHTWKEIAEAVTQEGE